jgi:imidazolonepropionase-like amidohydrolase
MTSHLITNVRILDSSGREPFTGAVRVDGPRIAEVLGFSAMETLVAATRLGGELMGMPGELGVVKNGALADLLLVDGDPLADIAVLADRTALRMIMKDGALHKLA